MIKGVNFKLRKNKIKVLKCCLLWVVKIKYFEIIKREESVIKLVLCRFVFVYDFDGWFFGIIFGSLNFIFFFKIFIFLLFVVLFIFVFKWVIWFKIIYKSLIK